MKNNTELTCPQCGSKNVDALDDENKAICTECYLEWPNSPIVSSQVVPVLDFKFFLRIAIWVRNYGPDEGLTKELFADTYGSVMGDHYLTKWESTYRLNIIAMIAYFGIDTDDGQKFCDMIYKQMTKYEQRMNNAKLSYTGEEIPKD